MEKWNEWWIIELMSIIKVVKQMEKTFGLKLLSRKSVERRRLEGKIETIDNVKARMQ